MPLNLLPRSIDSVLAEWSLSPDHKPLLVRGARQVGKTTAIRQLATRFDHLLEVNFEEHLDVRTFFEKNLSPIEIAENLSLYFNVPIVENKTLLFLDEIQACIPAISSLRFFYEKMPGLHIIAAGSLLEFVMQSIPSFGVGRIRSVFMQPMSFNEFLVALNEDRLIGQIQDHSLEHPLPDAIHNKLVKYLRKYMVLGGMPEVIRSYVKGENILECQRILDDLLFSYFDDFAKYKERVPAARISEIFRSVVSQLGGKFVLSHASPMSNHYQIKEALEILIMAGLVIPVTHSSANGIPIGAEAKPNRRKMLVFDTGIANRLAGQSINEILVADSVDFVNKGRIAELFVGLELLKMHSPYEKSDLFFWQREALNSNAEIDYVIQKSGRIIPIEVKSGTKGSMQSMRIFLKEKNVQKGVRISLENYCQYEDIVVIPLYAVGEIMKSKFI